MKIVDKRKFKARITEILIILVTIILTIVSINYAEQLRGYKGYGGECLIPVFGLLILIIIEDICENKKIGGKK